MTVFRRAQLPQREPSKSLYQKRPSFRGIRPESKKPSFKAYTLLNRFILVCQDRGGERQINLGGEEWQSQNLFQTEIV